MMEICKIYVPHNADKITRYIKKEKFKKVLMGFTFHNVMPFNIFSSILQYFVCHVRSRE